MKKLLFALLLLSLVACKKSDDATPDSKYLVTIKCTDCNVSIAEYRDGEKQVVKGNMSIPFSYVPSRMNVSVWSNLDKDNAIVAFKGGTVTYAELWVFSGDITKKAVITSEQLPPTR